MDPITAALAAGAAAGLTGVAAQAIQDAYGRLTAVLTGRFPRLAVHVQALETRPDSQVKQSSLAEELVEVDAQLDVEVLQLARILLEAIERESPEAIVRAGVDLAHVRASGAVDILPDARSIPDTGLLVLLGWYLILLHAEDSAAASRGATVAAVSH